MLCAKFGWKWPSGSAEEEFKSIFIISQLSPLWEGRGPSFEQTWIPLTKEYFVPSLVEIAVVLEKKSLQTDGQTNDGRQVIRKAHLSFQLRWAKTLKLKIITQYS